MKIAIVDDERPARSELKYLLEKIEPDAKYFEADSVEQAEKLVRNNAFDVIFLDINLGDINGITFASAIKEYQKEVALVFVTAYQEYAVSAFELEAVDYILKPFDLERLKKTMHRIKKNKVQESEVPDSKSEQQSMQTKKKREMHIQKLAVNAGDRLVLLDYDDIIFVEYNNRNSLIHTMDKTYIENYTMAALEEKLSENSFLRIHKSYLININYMEEITQDIGNNYGLRMKYYENVTIPISRGRMKILKQMIEI